MVDINLFEEEVTPGKKDKPSEPSSRREDKRSGDGLKDDDFNFDDDLSEPSLDQFQPEMEPVFEDDKTGSRRGKDPSGGSKTKKTSPTFLIIVVLAAMAVVAVIQFMIPSPQMEKRGKAVSVHRPGAPGVQTIADSAKVAGQRILQKADLGGGPSAAGLGSVTSGQTVHFVEAAKTVVDYLGKNNQFVALLLKGDRFYVEYGSETRGAADAVGQKIQALLKAEGFKASPEDRHRIVDGVRFCGVISGTLPRQVPAGLGATPAATVWNADSFVDKLNSLMKEKGLRSGKVQKFQEFPMAGVRQTPIRLRVEGARKEAMSDRKSVV